MKKKSKKGVKILKILFIIGKIFLEILLLPYHVVKAILDIKAEIKK